MSTRAGQVGRRGFVIGAVGVGIAVAGGCGPRRELTAEPQVVGNTIFVKVKRAWVMGERLYVQTWMKNQSKQPIVIDRDGMQLRLEDGEVLERSSGKTTQHTPYSVAAGMGRDVHVDFRTSAEKLQTIQKAWLIVGGVMIGDSTEAKVVGELELTFTEAPGAEGEGEAEGEPEATAPEGEEPAKIVDKKKE